MLRASFEVNINLSVFWMGSWESSHLPKSELQQRARRNLPQPWGQGGQHNLLPPVTQNKLPVLSSSRTVFYCLKPGKKETVYGDRISVQN